MRPGRRQLLVAAALGGLLPGCATERRGPPPKATLFAVVDGIELVRLAAVEPGRLLESRPLIGLDGGDSLVGIDFRVARGVLYALAASGKVYTVDTSSGRLGRVGTEVIPLSGRRVAMDFNPVVDRFRVMSGTGLNLRVHPDTAAVVARDPRPTYVAGDASFGKPPYIAAAGYTYNRRDNKLTTNYAIDIHQGTLVTQGTHETVQPAVSANSGALYTVGPLGTGPLDDASLDIADTDNTALAALRQLGRTRLYWIDLDSGRAERLGMLGDGRAVSGLAIEP
jgi:Domain of unknown function (DUF4394)